MKTKLQEKLRAIAPGISIETIWERDEDCRWDAEDPGLDPEDFWCWNSEVRASAIVAGTLVFGSAFLGGTWEKYGDHPEKSNPEISGYENQMTQEALSELLVYAPERTLEICEALAFLGRRAQEDYKKQSKEK